jgi:hypothetical protein
MIAQSSKTGKAFSYGMLPLLALSLLLSACGASPEKQLETSRSEADPASLELKPGYNDYVQRSFLKDGTEVGIVKFKDGSSSRYWFRASHLTGDLAASLFHLSDGTKLMMNGGFCCEVQLPKEQLASLDELRMFVKKNEGIRPRH